MLIITSFRIPQERMKDGSFSINQKRKIIKMLEENKLLETVPMEVGYFSGTDNSLPLPHNIQYKS